MKKTYVFLIFLAFTFNINAIAQDEEPDKGTFQFLKDYVNRIVNDTVSQEKSQFFLYPVVGYRPETGVEFGVTSLYVYYAKEDTSNRLSEINAYGFFTLKSQFGLRADHAIYSHKDKWFFLGDLNFEKFPIKYYGIGNNVPEDNIALVDATQIKIRERVLRRLFKDFYIGLETDFVSLRNVKFEDPDDNSQTVDFSLPFGAEGTTNFGIGAGLVYDERRNVLNERNAFFSEVAYLNYNTFWESEVEYNSIISDTRFFKSMNKRDVLAMQLLGEFNFGGKVPFNQLSKMGGQYMMRGYFRGRFRDENQIAAQVEYRFLPLDLSFSNRLGATVFAGVGEVFSEWNELQVKDIKWSAGVGARFLLFQQKDVYLRVDYAITPDENGFYIGVGEAF
ncbi:BamA/TamA family outer membrane protein [Psychroflexus sediminis]|uniref:Uncharacterized protein n=1 Tax=Psychroflexus sediminis TaxID=470826 RepID=A0A1G7WDY3_9FLAO|nr:BamA/TamA family outer membrane protein [Psychroflexus sediminis]SDG70245.1 hypothetical protein SAMN04488027_105164 [Psychroflexus sediminis]